MIKRIENEHLIVDINETGAELYSLKSKKTGTEYLWQSDPKYWKGRSPILFPICGRLYKGKYIYNGKEYEMLIHGFAKGSEFTSRFISDAEIEFGLLSNEETKKQYPFDFEFKVKYALKASGLEITYTVKNKDSKVMPFSFGAHPAFNVPFKNGENFEDYYIEFNKDCLEKIVLSDTCFYTAGTEKFPLKDGKLSLKHNLFDNDALFFTATNGEVMLKSAKNTNGIKIVFNDMTCLGLWHVPKTDAPYVCIEPWHGVPSDDGKVDDLSTKRQMIKLEPDEIFSNSYMIKAMEG